MHMSWKLQDAKAQFSQVVNDAIALGPQRVTRRGKEVAVILSTEEYENITSNKPTLKEFLLACPKIDEFKFERQKDSSKDIKF